MRNEVRGRLFPEAYLLLCEKAQPFLFFLNFSPLSIRHLGYFRLIVFFNFVPSGFLLVICLNREFYITARTMCLLWFFEIGNM